MFKVVAMSVLSIRRYAKADVLASDTLFYSSRDGVVYDLRAFVHPGLNRDGKRIFLPGLPSPVESASTHHSENNRDLENVFSSVSPHSHLGKVHLYRQLAEFKIGMLSDWHPPKKPSLFTDVMSVLSQLIG